MTEDTTPAVRKGDRYTWHGVSCEVLSVARNGTWANIRVYSGLETWTKRQPLPFAAGFERKP